MTHSEYGSFYLHLESHVIGFELLPLDLVKVTWYIVWCALS